MNKPAAIVCLILSPLFLGSAFAQVKSEQASAQPTQPVTVTLVRWPYT